ncbi:MAG TPA: hypothetical protein VG826_09615 [Pirellulales bacterium]|nr:hypothetical protein [Pirellulales bacterium]
MGNKQADSFSPIRLDLEWQRQRERFLDWGCEPRFPNFGDVVVISLFFLLVWGAGTYLEHGEWSVGAAAIASVALYSFRARSFEDAYQRYLRARGWQSTAA